MKLRPPIDARTRPAEMVVVKSKPAKSGDVDLPGHHHAGIRRLLWVYFWLLLIEGALRKWFLPGFANPLLVVRDPVVILIYFLALTGRIFPWNGFVIWSAILFVLSAAASLTASGTNIYVTLYGLRTDFLFLPLIYIIPKVFDLNDVEKIGRWLLISTIPMALLVALQFRSSPGAWINVGVGAAEGAQMAVGFGKIRPPGTFSFHSGLASYLGVVVAFLMSWLLRRGSITSLVALTSIPAAGLMIAVSGSRGVLTSFTVIMAGVAYVCLRKGVFFGKGVRAAVVIALAFFMLQLLSVVRQGMIVHEYRVTEGGGIRSGLIDRVAHGFAEPFTAIKDTPLLGEGIGLGTTVAGGLMYGERRFLLAETEWLRVMKESGPIIGLAILALRVVIVVTIGLRARRALDESANPLPMILFAAIFPMALNGQFGIATILGFATFGAGLCLAAINEGHRANENEPFRVSPDSVTNPSRIVRGRSVYAEKLHGR